MPGLNCKCGHRIMYGEIPCADEYLFISDTAFQPYWDEMDTDKLYKAMKGFLKCPSCGRLWVFWNSYQDVAEEFMPVKVDADK